MNSIFIKSWLSLKLWVKLWLFWINIVFLAALLFRNEPSTRMILLAYVASAPVLLWFVNKGGGGLTRNVGWGHIIPWSPLVVYLVYLLGGDSVSGNYRLYLWVLLVTVIGCLAFDIYDVMRWRGGETYTMGTAEAAAADASSHTLE